jgi:predicted CXXCH cytochrome family protein
MSFHRLFSTAGPVLLGLFLLLGTPHSAKGTEEDADDAVVFVSPWPGALIMEGPVVIAGRLPPGSGKTHFLLNGRLLEGVTRKGDSFSASINPSTGFNEVEVRLGDSTSRLFFIFGSRAPGQRTYSFHPPLVEGTCDPCHRERRGGALTEAALCYQCHRTKTIIYPFVHGPVAAGKCLICHDAHGSSYPSLGRVQLTQMCTSCHDQLSTKKHTDTSRSRVCTLCHDPHRGMNRSLLRTTF